VTGMNVYVLPINSAFSVEVFKTIGPYVPRSKWPVEAMSVPFNSSADGLYLMATFSDLPKPFNQAARQAVAMAGTKLVLLSPAAYFAAQVVKAKRWRDTFLYAAVPALFAVPLLGALSQALLVPVMALFLANLAALGVTQMKLTQRRADLLNTRFVADIPVPGLRLAGVVKDVVETAIPLDDGVI